jgi:hypothetical protein
MLELRRLSRDRPDVSPVDWKAIRRAADDFFGHFREGQRVG